MLVIAAEAFAGLVGHAYDCYPEESCGLLAGRPGSGRAERYYPCTNAARSARVYTIEPRDQFRAERDAERQGWEIVGVVHSHTHTEPFPSPTDVEQSVDPSWAYVIVSLKRQAPEVRAYTIAAPAGGGGAVVERPVAVA
jgi:proteasome lid subunit RPN8/RPN11